ncbi:cysQ [Acanthosepion pharaonis]|uniref:CysQ n=1 Tax=Acanthosepion pharaonis TaxID=158019 RepID=A0A812DL53_ACAPH|nr:cysQ [Sepia pharaonis]
MRLLSASVTLSHRAGIIIRDILKTGDLGIHDKGVDDLQTEADRSVQRCIIGSLQHYFPKISIIGEEELTYASDIEKIQEKEFSKDVLALTCPDNLKNVKENEVIVWVDPLDGTKEFTQGLLDHVTVLIGISVNGNAHSHQELWADASGEWLAWVLMVCRRNLPQKAKTSLPQHDHILTPK